MGKDSSKSGGIFTEFLKEGFKDTLEILRLNNRVGIEKTKNREKLFFNLPD